jgi:2-keto-3-deoxy-L-rhamnonate aldolase RhmA
MLLERAEFRRAYVPSSSRSTGLSRSRLKSRRSAGVGAVAMIETPDGLFECETICRRLGPKSVLVGLFDLSVALGHHGDVQLSEVLAGVEREIGAVRAAGLPIPMPVFARVPAGFESPPSHWAARAVRHLAIGADNAAGARAFRN